MIFKMVNTSLPHFIKIFLILSRYLSNAMEIHPPNLLIPENFIKSLKDCVIPSLTTTLYSLPTCSDKDCDLKSGQRIPGNGTIVTLKCLDKSYTFQHKDLDIVVCYNGVWFPKEHICLKVCKPLIFHTLHINCSYNGKPTSCLENVRVGTKAAGKCKTGFDPGNSFQENYCQTTGKWAFRVYECVPICGKPDYKEEDKNNVATFAPWNAGIYINNNGNYEMICGGTVVSEINILSAARCSKDESGRSQSKDMFGIAVGKEYMDWNDKRDIHAQKFKVQKIHSQHEYVEHFNGSNAIVDFVKHLVVFVIEGMMVFNKFVKPACMDFQRYNSLYPEINGLISGWNLKSNNYNTSKVRRFYNKVHGLSECRMRLGASEKLDTSVKFCTRRLRGLDDFYGAGITFKYNGDSKYYIFGVLTDHFPNATFYLGFRYESSASVIMLMEAHYRQSIQDGSIQ